MQLLLASTVAVLAATVAALPQGGGMFPQPCNFKNDYKVAKHEEFDDKAQLVSGYRCVSGLDDTCSLAEQATYTKTETNTVDTHGGFTLDLSEVAHASVDAGYSHSWATGNSTGTSATEQCPKGGVTCSLQVVTKMVRLEGSVHRTNSGIGCTKKVDENQDFKVEAAKEVDNAPPNQKAVMTFSPCIVDCAKKCDDEAVKALPKCPS